MSDNAVQEIKDRIDVAEVIGEHVQLRRAGTNLKGLCPFHSEKSPSFMVNRDRGVWRCFGCSEGGDVFAFLQKHEGLSFPEVLKILADRTGVVLPDRKEYSKEKTDQASELREDILNINELAARFYHEALLKSQSGQVARDYLKQRGLSEQTIAKWQLGFAPDGFHHLDQFLQKKGVSQVKAVQAGVLIKGEKGQIYDRFRFRVTFPLHDQFGRVVGFTSRTLSKDEQAKYINSPETEIYHKSKLLYGYYFGKKAIRLGDSVVMVEGNMDVIASHQAGVENVVASSGTALTAEQLNLIARLTKNITFSFDTDSAGQTATRRGLELALSQGFNVRIARLPGAKDPDDLIKQDPKLWVDAIKKAPNFLDFSFETLFANISVNDKEGLRKAAKEHLKLVSLVNDSLTQAQEAKRVSERLDVPVQTILDFLKEAKSKERPAETGKTSAVIKIKPKTRRELLEERLIGLSLVSPALREQLAKTLSPSDFSTVANLAQSVITNNILRTEDNFSYFEFLGEEELNRLKEEYLEQEQIEKIFGNLCRELQLLSVREQMKTIQRQIAVGETEELRQKFAELSHKLTQLEQH